MSEYCTETRKTYAPDVLVCGLGPAGVAAATAAARRGCDVLAVEKCGYAGGNITNANVIGVCGATNMQTGYLVTGGITAEMLQRSAYLRDPVDMDKLTPLRELDIYHTQLYIPVSEQEQLVHPNAVTMIYDAEDYKVSADRILLEAGVKILYHTFVCDVKTTGGHIDRVIIANKDGVSEIRPKIVVDCTGDADVAAWAGAPFEIKPDFMQAGTMMFVVGNVVYDDYAALKKKIVDTFAKAHADGVKCRFYGPGVGRLHHGVINFNRTRVPYNQTDAADWTRAEHEARGDIQDAMHILKTYMPEFRDSYLLYAGPHIGCRESRRLLGEYVLTIQDLYDRKRFADCIGLGAHPVDFHNPTKYGGEDDCELETIYVYQIPYRSLLPKKVDNLLVAGRCHSVDQLAAASTRVALTASVMGEAAGTAAVLALRGNTEPVHVNIDELVSSLAAAGAILDY